MTWTEAGVVDVLRDHYAVTSPPGRRGILTQVPHGGRVIDVLVVHEDGLSAIEVKVSRSDYRAETDAKRQASWDASNTCYYAAPPGVIDPLTLPIGWGLLTVHRDRVEVTERAALHVIRREHALALAITVGIRAAEAEDDIRRGHIPGAAVAALRRENARLRAVADRAGQAADREKARAEAARSELLSLDGAQECADCENPVTWIRAQTAWGHVRRSDETQCRVLRMLRNKARREKATGAQYLGGYPDPIEPRVFRQHPTPQEGTTR